MVDKALIEQAKEKIGDNAADIMADVLQIENYDRKNRKGLCCFHNEKTPSFSIKQDGQFFKCFGCGESGNVFNFIMKMENVDFLTAVEILCKQYGIEMPSVQDNEQLQKKKQQLQVQLLVKNQIIIF